MEKKSEQLKSLASSFIPLLESNPLEKTTSFAGSVDESGSGSSSGSSSGRSA